MNDGLRESLKTLNKEQYEAVTTTEGYVRVIAGAGSGKTRALTMRYAYLVDEKGIEPGRIFSVTFTNKAAEEMKTRVSNLVGGIPTPYIMTFHSFGNRFLRQEISRINLTRRFKIMDENDQMELLKVVYEDLGLTNADYPYRDARIKLIGEGCKSGERNIVPEYEQLLDFCDADILNDMMKNADTKEKKIIYGYLREQKRDGYLDFDDLENLPLYILKTCTDVCTKWQNMFDYIQVDEFQDVSLREVELLAILSYKSGNLFVVGDDSQCVVEGSLLKSTYGVDFPIEKIDVFSPVYSAMGNGNVNAFKADRMFKKRYIGDVRCIVLENGIELKVTLDHKLYAYRPLSPMEVLSNKYGVILVKYFEEVENAAALKLQTKCTVETQEGVASFATLDDASNYAIDLLKTSNYSEIQTYAKLTKDDTYFYLTKAMYVQEGDYLPIYDKAKIVKAKVVKVYDESYDGYVYDINVKDVRNYIVNNVVVHNCIYSFRGSDIHCIVDFDSVMDLLQHRHNDVKTIYLTINYRSTPEILDVSNALIKHNKYRLDKDLVTDNESGIRVMHYHGHSVVAQAKWVVNKIKELNYGYEDIAILYRNHASSRQIEEKLIEEGIPYEILSGVSFYARKEIKDVLAVLSLVAFEDNISFLRVVKELKLGIGNKKIDYLKDSLGTLGETQLYRALKRLKDEKMFKSTKADWLIQLIDGLKVLAERESISTIMNRVYTALNLEEAYKDSEIERWENLQELKRTANRYEFNQREKVDLGEYLSMLSLYTTTDTKDTKKKVKLMTIHGSKGLEFPVVFLIDMNEGLLPSSRTMTFEALEEERRIAYVAMTRAKALLFTTDAEGENYDNSYRYPSRFIFDIPRNKIDVEGHIDRDSIDTVLSKAKREEQFFHHKPSQIREILESNAI